MAVPGRKDGVFRVGADLTAGLVRRTWQNAAAGSPWRFGIGLCLVGVLVLSAAVLMRPASRDAAPTSKALSLSTSSESSPATVATTSPTDAANQPVQTHEEPPPPRWQTLQVDPGDTLSNLFARAGLDQATCARVMTLGPAVKTLRLLHPGDQLRLRLDPSGHLTDLRYQETPLDTLIVTDSPDGLKAQVDHLQPETKKIKVQGVVRETLSEALQQAGLSPSLAAEFVRIFHWRIDFRRQIQPGTRFALVYDKRFAGSKKLAPGPILAAELTLPDRSVHAFRFSGSSSDAGYYDSSGKSMHPTLIRTPVHYTRVSSPFSLHRFDPVVHVWRPHYGVDLAAPIGTPVRAAGNGRITYIGRDGGYGNLVKIKNFGPYSTRYAHLHRFAGGLHRGSYVHQGQIIGYVGETGETTGPHLHFEIRVNGTPRNPLTVHLPAGSPLGRKERHRFEIAIRPLVALLEKTGQDQPQLAQATRSATANLAPGS